MQGALALLGASGGVGVYLGASRVLRGKKGLGGIRGAFGGS